MRLKLRGRSAWICLVSLLLLSIPSIALAHSPFKGLNSFYNGLLHPLLVPGHLALLLATGLLFGQQSKQQRVPIVVSLLVAAIAGLTASTLLPAPVLENGLLAGTLLLGLLVILQVRLPLPVLMLVAGVVGFTVGLDSNPQAYVGKALFAALIGSGISLYMTVLYSIALAETLQARTWQQVLIRVLGSWISAAALLVLTLQLSS